MKKAILLSTAMFLLASCTSERQETPVVESVGPGGGTITGAGVTLNFPPGAVAEQISITIEQTDLSAPAGYVAFSPVFRFRPEGTSFAVPVQVVLPFAGEGTDASVFWTRAVEPETYDKLGGTIADGTITVSVTHFSKAFVGKKLSDGGITADGGIVSDMSDACPGQDSPCSPDNPCIDFLFVIDNSDSMKEEQDNLALQFPRLIDALRSEKLGGEGCSANDIQKCNIPNIRIGVVSSDLGAGNYANMASCELPGGDQGKLQSTPRVAGCSTPNDPWIQYVAGETNIPNSSGDPIQDVKDSFKCIASLGRNGCGFEHQLEAARRALDPDLNVNPCFLRPDAYLAIIFITDEDDCSAQNPTLFDPTQQGLTDPLGPLSSFRCFEFGISCDIGGREPGPRKSCSPGGDYLYKVDDYANFFANIKPEGHLFMFAIAGPTDQLKDVPFDEQPTAKVGLKNGISDLAPSCESGMGKGVPAIRIQALVEHPLLEDKGHKGYFNGITRLQRVMGEKETVNICSPDFGPALEQLSEIILASLGG